MGIKSDLIWMATAMVATVVFCHRSNAESDNASGRPQQWSNSGAVREMDKTEIQKRLSPLQFSVTQKSDTEAPFNNQYWNEHRPGLYVDVVSGEPLFSSRDKYDSGTGWPSFSKPVEGSSIVKKTDSELGVDRTEVRSKMGNSHLGHVFNDGPASTGQRFCINSASLRFIPVEDLEKEGYGSFAKSISEAK